MRVAGGRRGDGVSGGAAFPKRFANFGNEKRSFGNEKRSFGNEKRRGVPEVGGFRVEAARALSPPAGTGRKTGPATPAHPSSCALPSTD